MPREPKFLPPKPGKERLLIKSKQSNPQTLEEATKGMQRGEERTGFLGEGNIVRKPDYMPEPEKLDADGIARKKAIQSLLLKVIQPVSLSSKSTSEQDRRSLVNKLNKSSLDELKRFLPDRVKRLSTDKLELIVGGEGDITEEEKAEIQTRYMDLSP